MNKPGHAPMDDFALAVETVRIMTEAFASFKADIDKATFRRKDVMSPKTKHLLEQASKNRKELGDRIEKAIKEFEQSPTNN